MNGDYYQMPFFEFDIHERGKLRHIRSLHITDRMVQRAVCDFALLPTVEKYLIYDNAASLKNEGISFTRERLNRHLYNYYCNYGSEGYILLIDFRKFFDNIDHQILINQLSRIIPDPQVMHLVEYLISTFNVDVSYLSAEQYEEFKDEVYDSLSYEPKFYERTGDRFLYKSLGMGSQISQVSGIYFPTPIDNLCKVVEGNKYYGRYMDDTYVISPDKEYLKYLLNRIAQECAELRLFINTDKTQIQKLDHFTYLKINYTLTQSGRIIRQVARDSVTRERKKLKSFKNLWLQNLMSIEDIINQYKSWRGGISHFDSYDTLQSMDALFKDLFGLDVKYIYLNA